MDKKEILETIERLEIYRFDNVYTYEQLEKDKKTLNKLKEKLNLTDVVKSFYCLEENIKGTKHKCKEICSNCANR